jgi:hypothetical protein
MRNEVTSTLYAEHTDDPKSWASPRPGFDLAKFNTELERRGGCIGSVPRFRCRWAPDDDLYLLEEYDELIGYNYRDNGEDKFVSCKDGDFELPDGAIWAPCVESRKVWIPRFVIEEYKEPFYHKAWMIETIKEVSRAYGRIDLESSYREPSTVDLEMAAHLAYLRQSLTDEEIAAGVAALDHQEANDRLNRQEELISDMAEQTAKALTDGLPNAKRFGFNPNLKFDIREHSKNLIKEHDKRI